MMRIAYVALHFDARVISGGVGYKIGSQLRLWREAGHAARWFVLTRDPVQLEETEAFRFESGPAPRLLRPLLLELSRIRALDGLIAAVAAYQPDIIYLRYGLFSIPLQKLFRIAPVVLELNTNDLDEYRYRGPFFYLANRLTRGLLLGKAAGLVSVSREVTHLPQNTRFRKPMRVIGNGVPLEQYPELPAPANPTPVLAMIASPGYNWHGIDKLRDLAVQCPEFTIKIIGYASADVDFPVPPNMELLGFMQHGFIKDILAQADVAFGTLALHRKNMQGTSALKVNEALAYGIPLILAYEDTNVSDLDCDCLLRLPNTENNIKENVAQIREFVHRMIGRRVDRELVRGRIDQRQKERERLDFFDEIVRTNRK
jgi:glycosyl transferase family 4